MQKRYCLFIMCFWVNILSALVIYVVRALNLLVGSLCSEIVAGCLSVVFVPVFWNLSTLLMASFVGSSTVSFKDLLLLHPHRLTVIESFLDPGLMHFVFAYLFGLLVLSVGWSLWRGTKTNVELFLTSRFLLDMLRS